jgi:tryptophan halogenase
MSEPRELPRRVVVAGDGQVGVLAAIALRRALPSTEVTVVGTPPDPAAFADRAPTALPFTNKLHDRHGIDEERLVREAGASHRLVVRYRGWGGAGHEGVAPYGAVIDPKMKTGFARDWGGGPRNASTAAPR